MRAMILAAGKGTRLGELTRHMPKPLVQLAEGVRIIDIALARLTGAGINQVAVNLHHHGEQIRGHLETTHPDISWAFFPEPELLNTGGGIRNARPFLASSEHFVVSNSDILHFIPLAEVIREHLECGARATLVLKPSGPARAVVYSDTHGALGFTNPRGELYYGRPTPVPPVHFGTFTGIQVLHRSLLDEMPDGAFSIIDTYNALIAAGERVHVFDAGDRYWSDLGSPESLEVGRRVFRTVTTADHELGERVREVRSVFEGAGRKTIVRIAGTTRSLVAMTTSRTDELDDLDRVSGFLAGRGVPVPAVVARADGGLVFEDGGRQLLDAAGEENSDRLFEQAVDILVLLSKVPLEELAAVQGSSLRVFDRDNVLFDLRYFNQHVLGAGPDAADLAPGWQEVHTEPWADAVCTRTADVVWSWLADQPRAVMHRDFQSTNLIVDRRGAVRIVDLATLRVGFSVYDVASLAFDVYLPHSELRLQLLTETFFARFPNLDHKAFWGTAWLRLLQATATAFRYARDNPFFRQAIPRGFENLQRVISEPSAADLLAQLPDEVIDTLATMLRALLRDRPRTQPGRTAW